VSAIFFFFFSVQIATKIGQWKLISCIYVIPVPSTGKLLMLSW